MKQTKVELWQISIRIEKEYSRVREHLLGEYTEADKSYVGQGERKSKDKIMLLGMGYHSGHSLNAIYYETLCLKHQIEHAKKMCIDAAEKELLRRIELIEKMRLNYVNLVK